MSSLTVTYSLSETARETRLVETGRDPGREQKLLFDLEQLTPDQRRQLVAYAGLENSVDVCSWSMSGYGDFVNLYEIKYFDHELTLGEILVEVRRMNDELAANQQQRLPLLERRLEEEIDKLESAIADRNPSTMQWRIDAKYKPCARYAEAIALAEQYNAQCATWQSERGEQKRAREEREKADADAKRQKLADERLAWARAHGSDHLRRGLEAGHTCTRLYWRERAAVEYPSCVLDYEKNAEWKERACPSKDALDTRDAMLAAHPGAKATIVWLTDEPLSDKKREDEYDDEFEPCEALVVDDPDYDHYLIKLL